MSFSALIISACLYRLYVSIVSIFALVRAKETPQYPLATTTPKLKENYIFLFPVYKEQAIIEKTLIYYEQFLQRFSSIRLVFVTTAKEKGETRTYDLINAYLQKSENADRIELIECPILEGTKATQINYGLDFLREKYDMQQRVVCFDCDARIKEEDFVRTEQWIIQNPGAVIYSFVPKPVLSKELPFLVQSLILHHSERMLAFEFAPIWMRKSHTYPMGATMIIMPALWQRIHHIPEPIDDIPLYYLLSFYGLAAKSLPYFTMVQAPPDGGNVFRQIVPIFRGVFSYFSTAKHYKLTLQWQQKCKGVALYVFYCLEPIAIILACLGDVYVIGLILVQTLLDLYWLKHWSLHNFIAHCFGYVIRLFQFVYFLGRMLGGDIRLSQFKTDRGRH